MLTSGDVVLVDLGIPLGHEAGFPRPAVVVTAQAVLDHDPSVIHVVPLTSTVRGYESEVSIDPDAANGLTNQSAAQCQHVRSVSRTRASTSIGNIGVARLAAVRETLGVLLDVTT